MAITEVVNNDNRSYDEKNRDDDKMTKRQNKGYFKELLVNSKGGREEKIYRKIYKNL